MGIRHFIEYLLAVSLATDEARAAQEAQMVADQRLRQIEAFGDVAHRSRRLQAIEQNTQAGGIAQQAESFGQDRYVVARQSLRMLRIAMIVRVGGVGHQEPLIREYMTMCRFMILLGPALTTR